MKFDYTIIYEYPIGIILFLFTLPINLIYLIGLMALEMFDYDAIHNIFYFDVVVVNFIISMVGLFIIIYRREYDDGTCI